MNGKILNDRLLIGKIIQKHFSDNLSYSFLTGSFALGKHIVGKSDVDFCVVLKEKCRKNFQKDAINRMKFFILDYLKIHKKLNLKPDCSFPGVEIFTTGQVNDMCIGRGFGIFKNKIHLNTLKDSDFFGNIDYWYRSWAGMHCWAEYLVGSKRTFLENTNKCREFVSMVFLLNFPEKIAGKNIKRLILQENNVWKSFGVKERERLIITEKFLYPKVAKLISGDILAIKSGIINVDHNKIFDFEKRVVAFVKGNKFLSEPLFSLQELKELSFWARNIL